ncbi:MAG: alkene reductase [Gammaproteobacteria bacterium RIFCSPLOWO2_02_FULL_61_13]|nr:MAG: alkene reductase [Gammaproteobacteria bacterium RIFCSPLOWO2_02_FULL_61_13]
MTAVSTTNLFTPLTLGDLQLPNRIVMAPMTRSRAGAGNAPNCMMATYYLQRAGAGLTITEATQVSPQGIGYPDTPGIHSYDQIAGWRNVTDAVHAAGGRIFVQLWHVGRISHPLWQPGGELPVAPSAICPRGEAMTAEGMKPFVIPRALETEEIPGIVEQFARAATNAAAAGFDGAEIHAANGYLLDQFLRDGSNQRRDRYGGKPENRARLLLEVTGAVCDVLGAKRVGVRISPDGTFNDMSDSDPVSTFGTAVRLLNQIHPAYLHVVEGQFDCKLLRGAFSGLYMANGGYDFARGNAALASGAADLIAYGMPFIANPDLPWRFANNTPLAEANPGKLYGGDENGYTDYPPVVPQPASRPGRSECD